MRIGAILSAALHATILYAVIFSDFDDRSMRQPVFEYTDIALISEEEFRLLQTATSVETVEEVPTPTPPESVEPAVSSPLAESRQPEPSSEPKIQPQPEPESLPPPAQETVVPTIAVETDTVRSSPTPVAEREAVSIADEVTRPEEAARQDTDFVAPDAAPEPQIENLESDSQVQSADLSSVTTPEDEDVVAEPAEQSQLPQASLETVTEADETEAKALQVSRPMRRPVRAADIPDRSDAEAETQSEDQEETVKTPEPEAEIAQPEQELDIESLIAQDMREQALQADAESSQSEAAESVASQRLSAREHEGLKRAIQRCWNIGSLSDAARFIVVTVEVELDLSGRPIPGSLELLNTTSGPEEARMRAFEAARRAVLRCLNQGYELPRDKYESWQKVEIEFNPEEMRNR
ncbi:MAG: hypothetical protein OXE84_13620 [Rhodobacteraceae bacterium]|nr:hypothetical protein [Paracoccaceae bacterium]MCY4327598.1 hypothetical protein [Paracoccaceae bacterium]